MFSDAELELTYNVANAPVNVYPYPHFYIRDVFPQQFYTELQQNIPDSEKMIPIADVRPVQGYKERFVLDDEHLDSLSAEQRMFWKNFFMWLCAGRFANTVFQKFKSVIHQRFLGQETQFFNETLLIQDVTKYALGPHTDSPRKVISALFYLPRDTSQAHLGTSIYIPKDPAFKCPGGPHHPRDGFHRVHTVPFLPNSMFCFVKTDNSFHGVEPVTDQDTRRWLLLFDIFVNTRDNLKRAMNKGI